MVPALAAMTAPDLILLSYGEWKWFRALVFISIEGQADSHLQRPSCMPPSLRS